MIPPSQSLTSHKGLGETVGEIVNAVILLADVVKDNAAVTDQSATAAARITAYNNLIALQQTASYESLSKGNPAAATFYNGFKDKLTDYLKSVPLTVMNPRGGQHGGVPVSARTPLEILDNPSDGMHNGSSWHNATLYDLLQALTPGSTTQTFGVGQYHDSFDINNGCKPATTPDWIDSIDYTHGRGSAKSGIGVYFHHQTGVGNSRNYDFSASGSASQWENYASGAYKSDGSAVDSNSPQFQALTTYLAGYI